MYQRKYREKNYGEKNDREKNYGEKNDREKNDREKNYGEKNGREIPILDPKMAIFKQSQKSNQIDFRHAVNGILFLVTSLFEWYHIQVLQTLGKILFEAAKTVTSLSVSIAHTQPAAPKFERGGATLAQALDRNLVRLYRS